MDSPDSYENLKKHDLLGRVDTAVLYQPFLEVLNELFNICVEKHGIIYVATSGLRTYAEQDALYAHGRTVAPIGKGHIITNARGGYSPHNFGVGLDATKHIGDTYEGKLNPDYSDKAYQTWAEEGRKLGLDMGLYWSGLVDAPHAQWNLIKRKISWAMMRGWYSDGGYARVFAELDRRP